MNNPSLEELLQPTLSEESSIAAAPYSGRTVFLTGFFGGPLATIAIIGTNSYRLRRARDLPVLVLALAIFLVSFLMMYRTAAGAELRGWLIANLGQEGVSLFFKLEALIFIGAGFLLHRNEQRNADLLGLKRPNGWIGGLACLAGGIATTYLIALAMSR